MTQKLNPIVVNVLWNRLLSIVNEQQVALMRTAFSTVVRESQDLACGAFDTRGHMIAQSLTGTPGHINAMATSVRHFLTTYPAETLEPGDVLLTNEPWLTAGQINDITVLTPVFKAEQVIAYFANTCHSSDMGGRILSAEASEVYEEGLRIPITKLFRKGEVNQELIKLVRANVRTPDETIGDLYAQALCNTAGGDNLLQFMNAFGLETIDPLADEIIVRSERAMREAIRTWPNGRYEQETWSDGFEEPVRIRCIVTIEDEDILLDFAGSSPQSQRGINVVLNYTHAYASFAVKAAVSPEVPHNEGAFRPVHVTAPPGSILNCQEPAAVASRHLVGHFLPGVIFGALAKVRPERVVAGGAEAIWISIWRGWSAQSSAPFIFTLFQNGGMGARAVKDGLSTTGFPSGVAGVQAEVIESVTPLIQDRRELRTDSGGAGTFRGGLGQHTEMRYRGDRPWSVSAMIDRIRYPGSGLHGGLPGALGEFLIGNDQQTRLKSLITLEPQACVQFRLPGGGGYGSPLTRDPQLVLDDVINGYVSMEAAAHEYGVVVHYVGSQHRLVRLPEQYIIDWPATEQRRRTMQGHS